MSEIKKIIDRNRVSGIIAALALALASFLLLMIIYFGILDTPHPIKYFNEPFPVMTPETTPGGHVTIEADYCRYTNVPVTVYRNFISTTSDSNVPIGGQELGGAPKGCATAELQISVPLDVLVGEEYYVHYRFVYHVNPIGTRVVEARTGTFRIVEP